MAKAFGRGTLGPFHSTTPVSFSLYYRPFCPFLFHSAATLPFSRSARENLRRYKSTFARAASDHFAPFTFFSFFLSRNEDHCINSDCLLRVLSFRPGCSCLSLTLLFHRRPSCVLLPICFVSLATAGPYFLLLPPFSSVRSIHVPRQILIIPDPFQSLANSSDAIRRRFLRDSTLPPTVFILFLSTECLYRVASCPGLSGSSSHCHSVSFDRGAVSV